MSVRTAVLEGRIKQFVKSESNNLAFMLEDNQGNVHYCFSAGKKPILNSSDNLVLIGSYLSGSKFRISFILNKSKNTEENLIDTKFDWTYKVSLISAILVTCGIVLYLFFYLAFTPPVDPYGSYIFSFITLIISIAYLVVPIIILWVLTVVFYKSRKNSSKLDREILKLKEEYFSKTPSTSTIKTMDTIMKPKICPNCGGKLPAEAKFCPSCGSEF
jgi:membrane protein insertase Oxa1/YidC/SpoIIIJ